MAMLEPPGQRRAACAWVAPRPTAGSAMLPSEDSVILELEEAVRGGSPERRVKTLRQVTDLFLNDGARLSDEQIKVFDDVFCLLVLNVETKARSELSRRLAKVD